MMLTAITQLGVSFSEEYSPQSYFFVYMIFITREWLNRAVKLLRWYKGQIYQNLADIRRQRKIIEAGDAEILKLLKYLQFQKEQY